MNRTPIDADNRAQLPGDWARSLGLCGVVALERTGDGILIHRCPRATRDDIIAAKLVIGSPPFVLIRDSTLPWRQPSSQTAPRRWPGSL
jgi:hypothetical protein